MMVTSHSHTAGGPGAHAAPCRAANSPLAAHQILAAHKHEWHDLIDVEDLELHTFTLAHERGDKLLWSLRHARSRTR